MNTGGYWQNLFKKGAVLDPVDRISEVLFVLIMLLTFTGAISVSSSTTNDVDQLLWAAIPITNGLALIMLFSGGYMLGGYTGFKRFPTTIGYTLPGLVLVAITITLGG